MSKIRRGARIAAGLAVVMLIGSLLAWSRNYNYQEIAEFPTQLHGQMVQVTGIVEELARKGSESGTVYWRFKLAEQPKGRHVVVQWYVFACNRLISDFNYQNGHQVQLVGEFRRHSMKKVTNFLGTLEVNKQAKSEACKDQYRRRRH